LTKRELSSERLTLALRLRVIYESHFTPTPPSPSKGEGVRAGVETGIASLKTVSQNAILMIDVNELNDTNQLLDI